MKIDIITMHRAINYGAVLQTYATVKYFEKMGHDVEVIDYIPDRFKRKNRFLYVNKKRNKSIFHKLIFVILCLPGRIMHDYIFGNFIRKNIKLTNTRYYSIDELCKKPPKADVYITGSDQVWNTDIENKVDEAFFLGFVPQNKRKVSYSASFGKGKLKNDEYYKIKNLIDSYYKISVREDSGVNIVKQLGRNDVVQTLDPTLLFDKEQWTSIASPKLLTKKYLLIYQLNPNNEIIKSAKKIAKKRDLKIAKFGWDYIKSRDVDFNLAYRTPEDFLSAIKYSEFVVTDSFHGVIFAMNFNKQFICVSPPKYSDRLISILKQTKLEGRLIENSEELDQEHEEIKYDKINKELDRQRKISEKFILSIFKK